MLHALTWNLFHGRDLPPDPALLSWRSRLWRISERNATHIQVNRELLDEFARVLGGARWDFALLQECPPRWAEPLARACNAGAHLVLTSRNSLAPLRARLARLNPDLIAANEGGSNLTLVRGEIIERRELELRPGPRPERRVMGFTRARTSADGRQLCLANLHASAGRALARLAGDELRLAAEHACRWAGDTPLVLGGDLNLRPRETTVFAELRERFGFAAPTAPGALDHLLARGLRPVCGPTRWSPQRRELGVQGLALRLSDHAPVEASFE